MRKYLQHITVLVSLAVYLISLIGIGVHVCGNTGEQELSVPFLHLSCPAGSCEDNCCGDGKCGEMPSIGSKCHSDVVSVKDDVCKVQSQNVTPLLVATLQSYFPDVLYDTGKVSCTSYACLHLLPPVCVFSTVLRL